MSESPVSPAHHPLWVDEEQLVLPQDLFSASEDEHDVSSPLNGSFDRALGSAHASLAYHVALVISVFSAHLFPWCFVFPLLFVGSPGPPSLAELALASSAVAVYFSGAAVSAGLARALLARRAFSRAHWALAGALGAKALSCVLFGLAPAPTLLDDRSPWMSVALPLFAVTGLADGVVSVVAAQCALRLRTHEVILARPGRVNSVFQFLRNDPHDAFPVRMSELAGSMAGALAGYICTVGLTKAGGSVGETYRLAGDTLPGLVGCVVTSIALLMVVVCKKPLLNSGNAEGIVVRQLQRKIGEPRVRLPLMLLRVMHVLVPSASGFTASVMFVSLMWLLRSSVSGLRFVAPWSLVIAFFVSGLWAVIQSKVMGPDSEVAKTVLTVSFLGFQVIGLVVLLSERAGVLDVALGVFLAVAVFHCAQQEYQNRTQLAAFSRYAGQALGAIALVLAVKFYSFGQQVIPGMLLLCGVFCLISCIVLLVLLTLQLILFADRVQELSSYCLKLSRRRKSPSSAITDMLLAECRREIAALSSPAVRDLMTPEELQVLAQFTPPDDDTITETFLRECVSELRVLRKKVLTSSSIVN